MLLSKAKGSLHGLFAWSFIHGFSQLLIQNQFEPLGMSSGDVEDSLQSFIDIFCRGLGILSVTDEMI
jgi:hypothetical protein